MVKETYFSGLQQDPDGPLHTIDENHLPSLPHFSHSTHTCDIQGSNHRASPSITDKVCHYALIVSTVSLCDIENVQVPSWEDCYATVCL